MVFVLDVGQGGQHGGGVASFVGPPDIAHLCVQQQAHDVKVAVRHTVVYGCIALSDIHVERCVRHTVVYGCVALSDR